jgi:hypothetical protein
MSKFQKATRHKVFLKLAITGPPGSVKTLSAILLAIGLANGGKIALVDSENKSASIYSDRYKFDVLDLSPPFSEEKFIQAIEAAVSEGYAVLIIDSLSHAWLEILEFKAGLDAKGGNSYTNWSKAGAKFNKLMAAILQSQIHIICCLRSKMDYILEANDRGKMVPRKVGLAPIMRDGIEYDFSIVFEGDLDHFVSVSKDRTGLFVDQRFQVTEETGRKLLDWRNSASEADPEPAADSTSQSASVGGPVSSATSTTPPKEEPGFTPQEQLRQELYGIHEDWINGFLVDRKKIAPGQSVLDAPADYCQTALGRLTAFRKAITKFGEQGDAIVVGD